MRRWQIQDAKARFSELVRRAADEGPQRITFRGEAAAVVVSEADYERLRKGRGQSLAAFLRESPLAGVDLDLGRNHSPTRDVEL